MSGEPTPLQLDALKEIVNTGVGRAASALNEMVAAHIDLEVPGIEVFRPDSAEAIPPGLDVDVLCCVQLGFYGDFSGTAALVFPPVSATKLVAALIGIAEDDPSIEAMKAGTLNEVGNIIINSVIGTIGNMLERPFDFTLPNYLEGHLGDLIRPVESWNRAQVLLVKTRFRIRDLHVEGNIFLIFELGSFGVLLTAIDTLVGGEG